MTLVTSNGIEKEGIFAKFDYASISFMRTQNRLVQRMQTGKENLAKFQVAKVLFFLLNFCIINFRKVSFAVL